MNVSSTLALRSLPPTLLRLPVLLVLADRSLASSSSGPLSRSGSSPSLSGLGTSSSVRDGVGTSDLGFRRSVLGRAGVQLESGWSVGVLDAQRRAAEGAERRRREGSDDVD